MVVTRALFGAPALFWARNRRGGALFGSLGRRSRNPVAPSPDVTNAVREEIRMNKLPIAAALALLIAPSAFADRDGDKIRARLIGYNEVPSVSTVARGEFEAR